MPCTMQQNRGKRKEGLPKDRRDTNPISKRAVVVAKFPTRQHQWHLVTTPRNNHTYVDVFHRTLKKNGGDVITDALLDNGWLADDVQGRTSEIPNIGNFQWNQAQFFFTESEAESFSGRFWELAPAPLSNLSFPAHNSSPFLPISILLPTMVPL